MEREGIRSLEQTFGYSLAQLQELFADGPPNLAEASLPAYPDAVFDSGIGINAFGIVVDVESTQFPRFLNLVRSTGVEKHWLGFKDETAGSPTYTLIRTMSRFRGVSVKVLTNNVELIRSITEEHFNPTPPWVAMYEHGPFLHLIQGEEEYWFDHIWVRFWRSLTPDRQRAFVRKSREETRHYISDEEWHDWLTDLTMQDPRTRPLGDEALAQLDWF
ncbi:hypothetical protein [Paraburkholderia solisilvae]|nr:hypothetical protein [Paraburkholderia solisilvae]